MKGSQFWLLFGVLASICSNTEINKAMIAGWGIVGVASIWYGFISLWWEVFVRGPKS